MMPLGMSPFVRVLATTTVFSYRMRSNWLCVSSSGNFRHCSPRSTSRQIYLTSIRDDWFSLTLSLALFLSYTHLFSLYFSCAMFSFPFEIQISILAFVLDPVILCVLLCLCLCIYIYMYAMCVGVSAKLRTGYIIQNGKYFLHLQNVCKCFVLKYKMCADAIATMYMFFVLFALVKRVKSVYFAFDEKCKMELH